jgi:hypothetical protein
VAKQEEPPDGVRVYVYGHTPSQHEYELAVCVRRDGSRGGFTSGDEQLVNHFATRSEELFAQAAARGGVSQSAPPAPAPVVAAEERRAEASKWKEPLYDPWVIAIGATVVGGLIVLAITLAVS